MRILSDHFEVEDLLRAARRVRNRILFLDYDGTLAPFLPDRTSVVPYPGVEAMLGELSALPAHRLVFVSGRPARQLADLLPPLEQRPEIWGSHGMEELMPDGRLRAAPIPAGARQALELEAERLEAALGQERVERKPVGVAVHVRGLARSEAAEALAAVRGPWRELVRRHPLAMTTFDGGIELRAAACDKGRIVSGVLDGVEGPAATAFLGDDETDEDAFRAIRGRGAAILVRPRLRPTAADLWLEPPGELLGFLARWRDAVAEGVA